MHFPALLCLLSKQSIRQGHRALRVFESLVEAERGFPGEPGKQKRKVTEMEELESEKLLN
jgi:hypothetical protein